MDILVLVLLFALYVIPEVLRRTRKPKTYKYPEFPTTDPQPENPQTSTRQNLPQPVWPQPSAVLMGVAPDTKMVNEPVSAQPVALQAPSPELPVVFNNLAYGLVMAEILSPPRALSHRGGRRR